MPNRIIPILARLRQDLADCLSPQAIRDACKQVGYSWRDRLLDPVATVHLFLLQVLHGNTACQHVVHFGGWAFTANAYIQARKRLPLAVIQALLEMVASRFREATEAGSKWLGHRVWIVDGSSFSMSDVPALRDHFGQPSAQAPGCGFPVAHWVALFDLSTGMLLRASAAPMRTHDMSRTPEVEADMKPGDVVRGDRWFCSYAHFAMLLARGVHAVFRLHQRQLVRFATVGPATLPIGGAAKPKLPPRSQRVKTNGVLDQESIWSKPKQKPVWMTAGEFAALPAEIHVRELRYQVTTPGFRTRTITLATLLDAAIYSTGDLTDLYRRRWQVELNFRHMKTTMKMDILRCRTVEGVLKELAMFALAYNLVRSVMAESAGRQGVSPDRVGLLDALRWLIGPEGATDSSVLLINPSRPDRAEPRVLKRRLKKFPLMCEPRSVLRNRMLGKKDAA